MNLKLMKTHSVMRDIQKIPAAQGVRIQIRHPSSVSQRTGWPAMARDGPATARAYGNSI